MSWKEDKGQLLELEKGETYQSCFIHFINSGNKTSTYKYALFKSILDNLQNFDSNYELNLDYLAYEFGVIYWNLICIYHLPQFHYNGKSKNSKIESIIEEVIHNNPEALNTDFFNLAPDIQKNYLNKIKPIIKNKGQAVLGALYSDLKCKIYGFDKDKNKIYINQKIYDFMLENKVLLEKTNYFTWITWMEHTLSNENIVEGNLGLKLDHSTKRQVLTKFKTQLINESASTRCFYCGKSISYDTCEVDHFIPWKFIKDDNIWNFVLACKNCNRTKKDKIPSEYFLKKIINRNKLIFENSHEDVLKKLYKAAKLNGYIDWKFTTTRK